MSDFIWTQSEDEVLITWKVAPNIRGRDLNVQYTKEKLTVGFCKGPPIIQGTLYHAVHPDESSWVLESSTVTITLQKSVYGIFWPMLFIESANPQVNASGELISSSNSTPTTTSPTSPSSSLSQPPSPSPSPSPSQPLATSSPSADLTTPSNLNLNSAHANNRNTNLNRNQQQPLSSPTNVVCEIDLSSSANESVAPSSPQQSHAPNTAKNDASAPSLPSNAWIQWPLLAIIISILIFFYQRRSTTNTTQSTPTPTPTPTPTQSNSTAIQSKK